MRVYVDDFHAPFKGKTFSHLIADSDDELELFARQLGLKPEWKQRNHYDVSMSVRLRAIELGAKPITVQAGAKIVHAQRVKQADEREVGK